MNEYLLFNLIVFGGPFALSFDKKVHFFTQWKRLFTAMWLPVLVYILWDSLVSGRHWWFNNEFAGEFRLFDLPLGEILFFITVPYACIFSWEVMHTYFSDKKIAENFPSKWTGILLFLFSSIVFVFGFEYTGLALAALSAVFWSDDANKTQLFVWRNTWIYITLILAFTLVFNGYLTARPVVLYDYVYQLNWLVFTIPIEDFMYGLALMLWVTVRYESWGIRVRK